MVLVKRRTQTLDSLQKCPQLYAPTKFLRSGMKMLTNLEEGESTRWAFFLKDGQTFLQASNLCIALRFALLIRHNAPLTLWLELGNVVFNRSLLLVDHLEVCTAVLERHIQGFDLGLSTLDLRLLCRQGHLVRLHQFFKGLQVLPLFGCILFDRLAEFLAHRLKNTHDTSSGIRLCTSECRLTV